MKSISTLLIGTVAVLALTASADARTRHHRQAKPQVEQQEQYMRAAPHSYFEQRRDPGSYSGPMNAWDKARRDDSLLSEH